MKEQTEDCFHLGIKALVQNVAGQVLVLQVNPAALRKQTEAYWDLPGGRVQQGSTVEETLQREVSEETGVAAITIGKPLGMVLSTIRIPLGDDRSVGLILGVYACTMPEGAAIQISNEHLVYEWVEPKEAARRLQVKYPADFCALVAKL